MITTRQKKQIWARLRESLELCDAIYIPLDTDPSKTKCLERVAIIVGGYAAQLGMLLEHLAIEIETDEEQARILREFKQLYRDEQQRGSTTTGYRDAQKFEDQLYEEDEGEGQV